MDAGWYGGLDGANVLEDVEPLMCLMRKYYGTCNVTLEQRHAAYKDEYSKKDWTREQLIEWFPRDRAQMTIEQVREFADGLTPSV